MKFNYLAFIIIFLLSLIYSSNLMAETVFSYKDIEVDKKFDSWFHTLRFTGSISKEDIVNVVVMDMVQQFSFKLKEFETKLIPWKDTIEIQYLVVQTKDKEIPIIRFVSNDQFNQISSKSDFYYKIKNKYFCTKFGKKDVRCNLRYLEEFEKITKNIEHCRKKTKFDRSNILPKESTVKGVVALAYVTSFFLMFTGNKTAYETVKTIDENRVLEALSEEEKLDKMCITNSQ